MPLVFLSVLTELTLTPQQIFVHLVIAIARPVLQGQMLAASLVRILHISSFKIDVYQRAPMDIPITLFHRHAILVLISQLLDANLAFQHVKYVHHSQYQQIQQHAQCALLQESIQMVIASAETPKTSDRLSTNAATNPKQ